MPEIWLNYGNTEVVLDIKAENLDEKFETEGTILEDNQISSKLDVLDLSKPIELVVLNNSKSNQQIISKLYEKCEQKSCPKPRILADKKLMNLIKNHLPQESLISEFSDSLTNSNLVFLGEMEFDGLFGFETISTRLLKKFGDEKMLSAYEKRKGDNPAPGQETNSFQIANDFANSFDIQAIETIGNKNGIIDLSIGHPSKTCITSKSFVEKASKKTEKHKTLMISTGKDSSNDTLSRSLSSLWNCNAAIKDDGFAILLGECNSGIGSDAIQQFIEGRLNIERLKKPSKYVQGMEGLLFLTEVQKRIHVGLVSILPEFYLKKLNITSFSGIKIAMDYILKTQGIKQKVAVISDGARILLT